MQCIGLKVGESDDHPTPQLSSQSLFWGRVRTRVPQGSLDNKLLSWSHPPIPFQPNAVKNGPGRGWGRKTVRVKAPVEWHKTFYATYP